MVDAGLSRICGQFHYTQFILENLLQAPKFVTISLNKVTQVSINTDCVVFDFERIKHVFLSKTI